MPSYAIPARYHDGFRQLVAFDEDEFERLTAALEASRPTLRVDQLTSDAARTAGIDLARATTALEAVYSAASLVARDDATSAEVVAGLRTEELALDRAVYEVRLGRLLGINAVRITVRAVQLAVADERLLTSSRIVTDVRPVFSPREEGPPTPSAALVLHSLRLDYIEDGDNRTFSVLVDREDIARLRRALDRAEMKGDALVTLIERAEVPYLRGESED